MRADLVDVIEACYRPAASDDAWLEAVLCAMRPALSPASGVMGHFFDASDPTGVRVWSPRSIGCPDKWKAAMVGMCSSTPPELVDKVFRHPKSGVTASQIFGRKTWAQNPQRAVWQTPFGVEDAIGIVASDVTHSGCVLTAPLARMTSLPRRQTMQLRRLAVHVATSLRFRRRFDAAPLEAEAILHPDGRVAHAESTAKPTAAQTALRTFAKAVDRARGKLRRSDPDAAIGLWEGLCAGRWSLIDHFDTDGRRYLVAHKNDPELASPSALSLVERQVAGYAAMGHANKLIAYELGLSASTVSTHLGSAMIKLGVRSRADLTRFFGGIVGGRDT